MPEPGEFWATEGREGVKFSTSPPGRYAKAMVLADLPFPASPAPDASPAGELLAGQVIAVTGAEQGYGRLMGSVLARAGASVILVGNSPEPLAAAASSIEQGGGWVLPLSGDVAVPLDWMRVQERILEIFGALHGVVHIADKRAHGDFRNLSENEWMELFNANVKSSVTIAQLLRRRSPDTWLTVVGPHLDERGFHVFPQRGALRGLAEHAAQEGLRINVVLPGRASSGEEDADRPLGEVALSFAGGGLRHLRGVVLDVPLPRAPSGSERRSAEAESLAGA